MMGRWIGIPCCPGYAATSNTRTPGDGRIRNGWSFFKKEVTGKDFSIAWIQTVSFYMPSKVTLEEPRSIGHCWIKYQFCTTGVSTFKHVCVLLFNSGLIAGRQDTKRRKTNSILHSLGSYDRCARWRMPRRVKASKCTLQEQVERDPGCQILNQSGKRLKINDNTFGKFHLVPLSFTTLWQPTVFEDWYWQVQRDDSHQRGTGFGKPVADEEKKELQIDFRVQSGPQTAVDQDEDRTRGIEILAHMIQLQ